MKSYSSQDPACIFDVTKQLMSSNNELMYCMIIELRDNICFYNYVFLAQWRVVQLSVD